MKQTACSSPERIVGKWNYVFILVQTLEKREVFLRNNYNPNFLWPIIGSKFYQAVHWHELFYKPADPTTPSAVFYAKSQAQYYLYW